MYVGTLTCVHIVKGIGHSVQSLKEVVIINVLALWSNSVLVCDSVECRVHPLGSLYRCCALGFLREGRRKGLGGREGRKGWREERKEGRETREKLGGVGGRGEKKKREGRGVRGG